MTGGGAKPEKGNSLSYNLDWRQVVLLLSFREIHI
jgi:hypothetical protein